MPHSGEIKKGQTFQDGTGLRVGVGEIDASERVHLSVIKDRETIGVGAGEMSRFAFLHRFTRINSVRTLAHTLGIFVMSRADVYEFMARNLHCCPTLFRRRIKSQFALRRKATLVFGYCGFQ